MDTDRQLEHLLNSTAFAELVRWRMRMILTLTSLMVVVYSVFFLCLAFAPQWMAQPLPAQGAISITIWFCVVIILFSVLLSGFYMYWANHFDAKKDLLLDKLAHHV